MHALGRSSNVGFLESALQFAHQGISEYLEKMDLIRASKNLVNFVGWLYYQESSLYRWSDIHETDMKRSTPSFHKSYLRLATSLLPS